MSVPNIMQLVFLTGRSGGLFHTSPTKTPNMLQESLLGKTGCLEGHEAWTPTATFCNSSFYFEHVSFEHSQQPKCACHVLSKAEYFEATLPSQLK